MIDYIKSYNLYLYTHRDQADLKVHIYLHYDILLYIKRAGRDVNPIIINTAPLCPKIVMEVDYTERRQYKRAKGKVRI